MASKKETCLGRATAALGATVAPAVMEAVEASALGSKASVEASVVASVAVLQTP